MGEVTSIVSFGRQRRALRRGDGRFKEAVRSLDDGSVIASGLHDVESRPRLRRGSEVGGVEIVEHENPSGVVLTPMVAGAPEERMRDPSCFSGVPALLLRAGASGQDLAGDQAIQDSGKQELHSHESKEDGAAADYKAPPAALFYKADQIVEHENPSGAVITPMVAGAPEERMGDPSCFSGVPALLLRAGASGQQFADDRGIEFFGEQIQAPADQPYEDKEEGSRPDLSEEAGIVEIVEHENPSGGVITPMVGGALRKSTRKMLDSRSVPPLLPLLRLRSGQACAGMRPRASIALTITLLSMVFVAGAANARGPAGDYGIVAGSGIVGDAPAPDPAGPDLDGIFARGGIGMVVCAEGDVSVDVVRSIGEERFWREVHRNACCGGAGRPAAGDAPASSPDSGPALSIAEGQALRLHSGQGCGR